MEQLAYVEGEVQSDLSGNRSVWSCKPQVGQIDPADSRSL